MSAGSLSSRRRRVGPVALFGGGGARQGWEGHGGGGGVAPGRSGVHGRRRIGSSAGGAQVGRRRGVGGSSAALRRGTGGVIASGGVHGQRHIGSRQQQRLARIWKPKFWRTQETEPNSRLKPTAQSASCQARKRHGKNWKAARETTMQWYLVAALLTVLTSSQGILTTLSQSNGKYKYDYATIPFLAELFKLSVSGFFLWKECHSSSPPRMTKEWRSVRLYLVPSVIYLIHNNVQFATLTYVDPSTYQIMGNLKIVTTGILFRLVLKRKLSNLQWMAIVLLAVGTTTSQVKGCGDAPCDSLFSAPLQGYMLGILSACLSALAGVYTEYLMKKNSDSLYWQNVQLYTFGVMFNMGWLIYGDFKARFELGPWWQRLFNGYSITTWMVVFNLGSTGLLVSWLMKYSDNIVKVYSTSMAMLLTMVLSIYLFSMKATIQLFLGIIICIISLQMYFMPVHMLVELPQTLPVTSKLVLGNC